MILKPTLERVYTFMTSHSLQRLAKTFNSSKTCLTDYLSPTFLVRNVCGLLQVVFVCRFVVINYYYSDNCDAFDMFSVFFLYIYIAQSTFIFLLNFCSLLIL